MELLDTNILVLGDMLMQNGAEITNFVNRMTTYARGLLIALGTLAILRGGYKLMFGSRDATEALVTAVAGLMLIIFSGPIVALLKTWAA